MCRIFGVIDVDDSLETAKKLIIHIKRNETDYSGLMQKNNICLGMCQLQIRIPLNEKEKIPYKINESVWCAYNGTVYEDGLNSGKEEVSYIYDKLTNNLVVDGMVSLAILEEDYICLYRDKYGIKPLYYFNSGNKKAFCSEMQPLFELSDRLKINIDIIQELICFGWPLGNRTIIKDIYMVEPNTLVKMDKERLEIYKGPKEQEIFLDNLNEYILDAVKKCSVTNCKLALALSGGTDSTIIAVQLNQLGIKNIDTISIKIEGSNDYISNLKELNLNNGNAWKTWKHHVINFTSGDFINYFNESIKIYGQPTYMSSVPLIYALAKATAELNNIVLLTGEGADELFLGYQSYRNISEPQDYLNILLNSERKTIIKSIIGDSAFELTKKRFREKFTGDYSDIAEYIKNYEMKISLEPLLQRQDHLLMHYGIEGRTPFLHSHISTYANRLKYKEMIYKSETKFPISNVLKHMQPNIARKEKVPFRSPIHIWFNGILNAWVKNKLNDYYKIYKLLDFNLETINEYIKMNREWTKEETRILYFLLSTGSFFSQINQILIKE